MILIFIIAVSLSMDAFSLALAYGTNNLTKKERNVLSLLVGIYHFFMPIFGMCFGKFILNFIPVGESLIVLLIFSIIGINMIIESIKGNNAIKSLRLKEMIIFGFAVSIDSFSVGIGINSINDNYLLCSFVFSLVSCFFTYIGLFLGNRLNLLIGKISTLLGGVTLILFGLIYFFK